VNLKVEILSTGDELLTGQVVDTNSAWLMDRLWDLGVMVRRKTLVGDDRQDLLAALRETTARADLVVMSGGLGATEDDLTRECVAAALGVPVVADAAALAEVRARYAELGRTFSPNNEKLGTLPAGATLVPNRFGTAPAFRVALGRAELWCLPGVREEFRGLCEEAVLPRLAARTGDGAPAARLVKLFGVWEAHADQAMRPVMDAPEHRDVRFGYRAHWPEIHVKWSVPGPGAGARADRILADVRRIFGDALFAEGKEELAGVVVARLAARGERVAVAQCGTGAALVDLVSAAPGGSAALGLGLVVDDGEAAELAESVRRRGHAAWGLAVVGDAPDAGPAAQERAIHLALAGPGPTRSWTRSFRGDGALVRKLSAYDALNELRLALRPDVTPGPP
jgi:nicotinamide-nucleotide amidase